MTILEKIKFEEDWLSEVSLTKENVKIALEGIRATVREQQPCEDCISRESVRQLICKNNDKYGYSDRFHEFTEECLQLSSITPKQKVGKWLDILDEKTENTETHHDECSNCGYHGWPEYSYCPNCGSYNGGEEE